MANHKSAEKRARQRIKRNQRNRRVLGALRTSLKKARSLIDGKQDAGETVSAAVSLIDRAVTKGVMHRKTASRLISRISRRAASPST